MAETVGTGAPRAGRRGSPSTASVLGNPARSSQGSLGSAQPPALGVGRVCSGSQAAHPETAQPSRPSRLGEGCLSKTPPPPSRLPSWLLAWGGRGLLAKKARPPPARRCATAPTRVPEGQEEPEPERAGGGGEDRQKPARPLACPSRGGGGRARPSPRPLLQPSPVASPGSAGRLGCSRVPPSGTATLAAARKSRRKRRRPPPPLKEYPHPATWTPTAVGKPQKPNQIRLLLP